MDNEVCEELEVPSAFLNAVTIGISTETEKEKLSVIEIGATSEVVDSRLGLPNLTSQCSSCGAKNLKCCEGHFGLIQFRYTIQHPYFLSEVAKVLNKICPGCKSIRKDLLVKGAESVHRKQQPRGCNYCVGKSEFWYPRMKFKLSTKDPSWKSAISVEIGEKLPKKLRKRLADDYWDFIERDAQQEESCKTEKRMILYPNQVYHLLKDVDQGFIEKFISKKDSIFINSFPVTPNSHRVSEVTHRFSSGKQLMFDARTRLYKKMFSGTGNAHELSSLVSNFLKTSKLNLDKSSNNDFGDLQKRNNNDVSGSSGLRWIKDVMLGKRNDHCFRMVVTGDPNIKLSEIGIPCHIAERLQISEHLNSWNWERLNACCSLRLFEKGKIHVRRKGSLVGVQHIDALQVGDIVYRPLSDGDIILINRPPSIHQHSLIALSVKVLPVSSVVTINPLCCSPFRGDFDGDCLHGYVPQSVDARVELRELVALDKQLINQQSGRNLLSLSHDSLTAAHLLMEDGVCLSLLQMQQLQMFCPYGPPIVETASLDSGIWTGKQLFSMLLPPSFEYSFPSKGVYISKGEIISSEGSSWLRDSDRNLLQSLIEYYEGNTLDFLYMAQEVLCEWLTMRGLSVSLSDLYLASDSCSWNIMMDEIFYGLQEAEQTCNFNQLMVDSCQDFLIGVEDNENATLEVERLCYEKQGSAALCQASVDAFKQVFRDLQNLAYNYASNDNALMAMFKAGSKGNLLKVVQQSMCLGVQHSLVPLSFRFPHKLSCVAWNCLKADDAARFSKSYIPYAVVENSFLTGLNPLDCFVNSVTSRDSSFSDNADLPGTLNRRLSFFMRDLYTAYDGTVRNAYGNQLIQFSYDIEDESKFTRRDGIGGHPVGSLSACAISEAAYSALDQPISLHETSPLLNLKNVLECGSKKSYADQTMSLYLSKRLGTRRHGFEYGALEVKNHLECLKFKDIVSTVMIMYSPQAGKKPHYSPWICHFHVCKEKMKRRRLSVCSIINSLYKQCTSAKTKSKINLSNVHISSKDCSSINTQKEYSDSSCITVVIVENSERSSVQLEAMQKSGIPFLLNAVIKGFREIKKVDILWKDSPKASKSHDGSLGELYLRVFMSRDSGRTNLWSVLVNYCLQIMNMIDWTRSHPDNINSFCLAYGIDTALICFLNDVESAISDTNKSILPKHLLLLANSLSYTGEFVGLNAKGLAKQRGNAYVSSPFMQACFSNPGACFIKAAKRGIVDNLQGSIDSLVWGKVPSVGTGGHFELIYSGEGHKLAKPVDVYNLLSTTVPSKRHLKVDLCNAQGHKSDECSAQFEDTFGGSATNGFKNYQISRKFVSKFFSLTDVLKLDRRLKNILYKYPIDHKLNESDKDAVKLALCFHPRGAEKIGAGVQEMKRCSVKEGSLTGNNFYSKDEDTYDLKVINHPEYQDTRCFSLTRIDGTMEDFSYHKCVLGALEIIAPGRVNSYHSKCLRYGSAKGKGYKPNSIQFGSC